jgi:hypothetical protein
MRRFRRGILLTAGLAASLALGGCESFDLSDYIDFNKKKPVPGERKLVFPEGVPGVPQGVPAELVKGHQQPPDVASIGIGDASKPAQPAAESETAAKPEPAAKPKVASRPKSTSRPKAKPQQARRPKAAPSRPRDTAKQQPDAQPSAAQPSSQPVAQKPAAPDNSVWGPPPGQQRAQGANAPWPAPANQPSPSPWPNAPNPNQFSR